MAEQDTLRSRFRNRLSIARKQAERGYASARDRVGAATSPLRERLGAATGAARESWRNSGTPQRPTMYVDGAGRASAVPPGERGRYTTEGATGRNNPNYQGSRVDPPQRPAAPVDQPAGSSRPGPGRFARYGGGALAAVGEVPQLAAAAEEGALADELPRSAGRLAGATYGMRIGNRAGGGRGRGGLIGGLVGGTVGYVGGEKAVDAVMNATTPSERGLIADMRDRRAAAGAEAGGPDDTTGVRAWNNAPGAWASSDPKARREAVEASGYQFDPSAPENQLSSFSTAETEAINAAADRPGAADIRNPDGTIRQSRTISEEDRAASAYQPTVATAAPNTAREIQGVSRRTASDIYRRANNASQRASSALLNPMGAQAELVRRLNNTQRSYMNRGSPQARRLAAQPYLDALGLAGQAETEGLRSGNDALVRGSGDEAAAHEGFARRTDAAQQANMATELGREEIAGKSYRETMKTLSDQNATEAERQQALTERYDLARAEWLEQHPGDFEGADRHAATRARREGLVDERGVPQGRSAALQISAELQRQFEDSQGPGFLGARSLGRLLSGTSAGDPQLRGGARFDPDNYEEGGPRGVRQWLATGSDESVWRDRLSGQEIIAPSTGRRHERARDERYPRRSN